MEDSVRIWPSGMPPITSGRSPAAALEVRIWLNWSSATGVSSTSIPVSAVNASTMACVAATRSGRSSSIQTVIVSASPPPPPSPSSSELQAASEAASAVAVARRAAARARRVRCESWMDIEASGVGHTFVQRLDLCHTTVKQLVSSRHTSAYHRAVPTGPGDILDLIRHGRATTRGDVLEVTGLSRMTVAQRLDALLAAGMIVEGETGEATGGRRRRSLVFNSAQSWVLAAAVDTTHTRLAVTDLHGTVLGDTEIDVAVDSGPSVVLDRIAAAMEVLLDEHDLSPADLCGAGLSLPGPVDPDSGRPSQPPILPGWDAYPVVEHLQADAARRTRCSPRTTRTPPRWGSTPRGTPGPGRWCWSRSPPASGPAS